MRGTAHPYKVGRAPGRGELVAQLLDQHRAVVLSAGFAGRDEEGGHGLQVIGY